MKYIQLFLVFLISASGFAQIDFGGKTVLPSGMLAPRTTTIKPEESKSPSIFDSPASSAPLEANKKPFSMTPDEEFVDANKPFLDKLNKKVQNEDLAVIRRNINMGSIKTNSEKVFIQYRDAMAVDGDMIKIYANQTIVRSTASLSGSFQGFSLNLLKGFNTIEFEALNQGLSGPNTAEMEIVDDNGAVLFRGGWDLATGFKASVIVFKE